MYTIYLLKLTVYSGLMNYVYYIAILCILYNYVYYIYTEVTVYSGLMNYVYYIAILCILYNYVYYIYTEVNCVFRINELCIASKSLDEPFKEDEQHVVINFQMEPKLIRLN